MLSTNKLRSIYSKIQTQLFYMIPEKWEKICLYASIIEQVNNLETGEMFFYYYPAGLLKRNPINVYEIPSKFNIDEEEYTKLVNKLYKTFIELRQAFKESTEEKMWTNLTITIQDYKFNVEYSYDELIGSTYTSEDRHIIWKCKYLNYPVEKLTKKDKIMIKSYYEEKEFKNLKSKIYSEGMYKKKVHNIVEYNTENDNIEVEEIEEKYKDESPTYKIKRDKKIDKYELYKLKQEEKKKSQNIKNDEKKNQILNV